MTDADEPLACESCGNDVDADKAVLDPDGHPVHASCLRDEMDQLAAEKAAVRSGRGDLERW